MFTAWWDEPADGPTNMAADEALAAEAERRGGLLMRLYGWSTTTISLGAFQKIDDARLVGDIRGRPLVRRPSGGSAIVHGSDLTYAAAVPKSHPWGATPQVLYDALHAAMAEALAERGVDARPYPTSDRAADESLFFCFDRRSPGDLVVFQGADRGVDWAAAGVTTAGSKVMGSAQRRLAGVVLQHGSLLLDGNAAVTGSARHPAIRELFAATRLTTPTELAHAWLQRIAAALQVKLQAEESPFVRGREAEVAEFAHRFREDRWTARR